MPLPALQVQPVNLFADYAGGQQAAQQNQAGQIKNALAAQTLGQSTRQNALYSDPNATPEQFIRAGDTQTGTALQNVQQQGIATKQAAVTQLSTIAQRMLMTPDPVAAAQQFVSNPANHPLLSTAGYDPTKLDFTDPTGVKNSLQSLAAIATPDEKVLSAGSTIVRNGVPVLSTPGKVDYEDAGDQKIPVDSSTGVVRKDLPPIKKGIPPGQQFTDQSVEGTAQMIANRQIPMISGFALKTPWGQQVIARVGQINPAIPGDPGSGYQGGDYAARNKTLNDFTSGKSASTVRSLNVGIAHLGTLGDLASALDNGDVQVINRLSNAWKTQTGSTAPTNFAAARSIVANEVVKAVTASGGGVTDRKEAQDEISSANSPQQLQQVISTWKQLLSGQLGGLKQQYEQGTKRQDFNRFLSPDVISQLEPSAGGNAGAAASLPTATGPNGQKLVLKNGQWSPQ